MENEDVVEKLGALASVARLDVYRFLVRKGPDGVSAGEIGAACGIPASTLSHHLNQLRHAGLIERRREARSLLYSARLDVMTALVGFLSEECCEGQPHLCDVQIK